MVGGKNWTGANFLFPELGISVEMEHGYSIHAPFKELTHGVGHILPLSPDGPPPQCIAMALYSHSDVFEGVARHSAASLQGKLYSDPTKWLPYYPGDFSIDEVCNRLAAEEMRLEEVYLAKGDMFKAMGLEAVGALG